MCVCVRVCARVCLGAAYSLCTDLGLRVRQLKPAISSLPTESKAKQSKAKRSEAKRSEAKRSEAKRSEAKRSKQAEERASPACCDALRPTDL